MGPRGIQGVHGEIGPIGPQGAFGPQGIQGEQGIQGLKGDTGDIGLQGFKGDKGDTGDIGPKGDKGDQGIQGVIGPIGIQGVQGIPGIVGPIGLTGPAGIQGIQGIQGEIGPVGPQGIQGSKGDQGVKGDQGPMGPIGFPNANEVFYDDSTQPYLKTKNVQDSIDFIKNESLKSQIKKTSLTLDIKKLNAVGDSTSSAFLMGKKLPSNSLLLSVEVDVSDIITGKNLKSAKLNVQNIKEEKGSLIKDISLSLLGVQAMNGYNQYLFRGNEQITIYIDLDGCNFTDLNSGNIIINMFYTIVSID